MTEFIEYKADLYLKPTERGGRKGYIASGYRPDHVFEYTTDNKWDKSYVGAIVFIGDYINPGEKRNVLIRFLNPEVREKVKIGTRWWIHEGKRVVGEITFNG